MKQDKAMNKAYKRITDQIIKSLEAGTIPWRKPWTGSNRDQNPASGTIYRGINMFLLACSPFGNPNWVTFNQAKKAGGKVKKGEKGTPVIFWAFMKKEGSRWVKADPRTDDEARPILKYYTVFNVEQCEGIPESWAEIKGATLQENERIEKAESILESFSDKPRITHSTQPRAYYSPSQDLVHMPNMNQFISSDNYYATLFHELAHSTGHQKRLNREEVTSGHGFGSKTYAKEELVAEMAAAFLSADAGLDNSLLDSTAAYIESWLKVFRQPKNEKLVIMAASAAQKAADHITGKSKKATAAA